MILGVLKFHSHLLYSKNPLVRIVAQLYEGVRSLVRVEENRVAVALTLWTMLGVAWGMWDQQWDLITATHFAVCHFGMSYRQHNRPYSNTKVLVKCWCKFAVCHICRPEAQGWNLWRERFWSDGLGSPGAVQRP